MCATAKLRKEIWSNEAIFGVNYELEIHLATFDWIYLF